MVFCYVILYIIVCFIHFCATCLQLQHPLIAEFPSRHFYDGKLKTAPNHECRGIKLLNIWRRNRNIEQVPLMFCHVEGAEKMLTVSTAEGSEQSRSNDAERDEAVSIRSRLLELIVYWSPGPQQKVWKLNNNFIFTARCYASAVLAMALCLSVRLSVTCRSSTKTAKRRITETTPHDSPRTLDF